MRPDVVTFWHGPLDRLRQTCLTSQVAAGHNVTVYSFEPLAGLPDGVGNAEAEAILPHAFSERLRPPQPDGSWRDWTTLQFSDFFRMRLMAQGAGLWLDADVLLLRPVEIDPAKPFFAWERRASSATRCSICRRTTPSSRRSKIDATGRTDAGLAGAAASPDLRLRKLRGKSNRLADIRVAIFGPAALTALAARGGDCARLPKKSFYAVHAEPTLFFDPSDFSG